MKTKYNITIFLMFLLFTEFPVYAQWDTVGNRGFSSFEANMLDLALDQSGQPWVAFRGIHSGITVMTYNGISWDTVGQRSFSDGGVSLPEVSFDYSNTPYVVYTDEAHGDKATVMKYDGTNWISVGPKGFTLDFASFICLVFNPI